MEALAVDPLVVGMLQDLNDKVSMSFDADCIFINSPILSPLDEKLRVVLEELKDDPEPKTHLAVLLETNGGMAETVERMVFSMRHHYDRVSFIVPNYAYSAGTILALSGDAIWMDYFSVLGPIDPQYPSEDGGFLPGLGYLSKYQELLDRINNSENPAALQAEIAYLIKRFDPAQLFHIEQGIEQGKALIKEWLPKYKFKDWTKTKSSGRTVDANMREKRAGEIAEILGDAKRWHSHGRGIPMKELTGEDIKLEIDDFGQDKLMSDLVRHYHGLCVDYYSTKSGMVSYIHTIKGARRVL